MIYCIGSRCRRVAVLKSYKSLIIQCLERVLYIFVTRDSIGGSNLNCKEPHLQSFVYKVYMGFLSRVRDWTVAVTQYSTVQYSTVQYSTVQYSTVNLLVKVQHI